jgi:hypothetical protein
MAGLMVCIDFSPLTERIINTASGMARGFRINQKSIRAPHIQCMRSQLGSFVADYSSDRRS